MTVQSFFRDLVRAQLKPDLNAYRGLDIDPSTTAEGLLLENWGKTFMLHSDDRGFQGIYVGAGPYLAARAYANFESELVNILEQPGRPVLSVRRLWHQRRRDRPACPCDYRRVSGTLSVFLSGGGGCRRQWHICRRELPLPARSPPRRLQCEPSIRDRRRRPRIAQSDVAPFSLDWHTSSRGRGMAVDAGVAFAVNRWDFGFGVGGIANRITWRQIERHVVSIPRFFGGIDFVHVRLPAAEREASTRAAGHLYRRRRISQGEVVSSLGGTRGGTRPISSARAGSTGLVP